MIEGKTRLYIDSEMLTPAGYREVGGKAPAIRTAKQLRLLTRLGHSPTSPVSPAEIRAKVDEAMRQEEALARRAAIRAQDVEVSAIRRRREASGVPGEYRPRPAPSEGQQILGLRG